MAGRRSKLSRESQELWQMAQYWLASCKVLPPGHRVYESSPTVFDLAHSLRDGVALCQIANCLRPYAVRDINLKPQMSPFLCLKNIRGFLHACVNNFGLKENVLFDAHELYDVSDFGKVVTTLSHLSKCKDAINAGLCPFPSDRAMTLTQQPKDEDIYGNLEDLAMTKDVAAEENIYDAVTIEDDTKIYDDVVSIRKMRSKSSTVHDSHTSKADEKRAYVIDELLGTEQNYVDALTTIKEKFIDRLENVLSPEDSKTIFVNIKDLLIMHQTFLVKLERACKAKKEVGCAISNCFILSKDDFLEYGKYCREMQTAQNHVDKLCEYSPEINRKMMECCQKANDGKFSLRSLLVVPMQRVLKYPLLLRELIKHSKTYNIEKASLEKALQAMQDVAHYINAVKRDDESRNTVNQIQASLILDKEETPPDLLSYGLLVKDGDIQVKINEERAFKKRQTVFWLPSVKHVEDLRCFCKAFEKCFELYAFLFDRVLLMCKLRGEQYDHKETLFLDHYNVSETASSGKGKESYTLLLFAHGWKMSGNSPEVGSGCFTCEMFTKTEDMKRKWVEDIQRTISNLILSDYNLNNHRFELSTFQSPTYCVVCKSLLWGLINQGYSCKACKYTCHKDCIEKSLVCKSSKSSALFDKSPIRGQRYPSMNESVDSTPTSPPLPPRPSNSHHATPQSGLKSQPRLKFLHVISPLATMSVVSITRFHGHAPDRKSTLTFDAGEEIEIIQQTDPEWWEGKSKKTGKQGFFPRNHVETIQDSNKKNAQLQGSSEVDLMRRSRKNTLSLSSVNDGTTASNVLSVNHGECDIVRAGTKYVQSPDIPMAEETTIIDEDLTKYKWFVGKVDRDDAKDRLEKCSDGTFLVRESSTNPGQYALSLRYSDSKLKPRYQGAWEPETFASLRHKFTVKHIKILTSTGMFCVTALKLFPSIASLIDYYRNNTLGVSFPGLDTCLTRGINESRRESKNPAIGHAIVKYDYTARDPREISIKKQKVILIMNKDGDWWKGENSEGQVGFFPSNFVRMLEEDSPAR